MITGYGRVDVYCSPEELETYKEILKQKGYSWDLFFEKQNNRYFFKLYIIININESTVKPQ